MGPGVSVWRIPPGLDAVNSVEWLWPSLVRWSAASSQQASRPRAGPMPPAQGGAKLPRRTLGAQGCAR